MGHFSLFQWKGGTFEGTRAVYLKEDLCSPFTHLKLANLQTSKNHTTENSHFDIQIWQCDIRSTNGRAACLS